MPIIVTCAQCATKLSAPDTAVGKKIRCPKCQTVCAVPAPAAAPEAPPAFEVVDGTPPAKPKAVAKARALPIPDDDEDDRPRTKRRAVADGDDDDFQPRKRKSKRDDDGPRQSQALLIGGIIGGVLLIAGVGFATYWFGVRGKVRLGGDNGPAVAVNPEQWETYTSPRNVFRVSFPGQPEGKEWQPNGNMLVVSDIRQLRIGDTHMKKPELTLFAGYVRFPDGASAAEIDDAKRWLTTTWVAPALFGMGGGDSQSSTKVSVNGREWVEEKKATRQDKAEGFVRWHQAGPILHLVGYRSKQQELPKEVVEKFVDSHEILGGDPLEPEPGILNNWQAYTSPDNVFRASFPGATTAKTGLYADTQKYEFREYAVKDEKGGTIKSYFAGYARFATKPTHEQLGKVKEFLQQEAMGYSASFRSQRVPFAGWPWGEERQSAAGKGLFRLVEAGTTVYAAGIRTTKNLLSRQEIDKFYHSFAILDAQPEPNDREVPPGWKRYLPKGGGFQALMPGQVHVSDAALPGTKLAIASATMYSASDLDETMSVIVVRFSPNASDAERQRVVEWMLLKIVPGYIPAKLRNRDKVAWAGRESEELTYSPENMLVARLCQDSNSACLAAVSVAAGGKLNPDIVQIFFNNFTFPKRK